MKIFLKKYKSQYVKSCVILFAIFILSFIVFYPSLSVFFTNDDFFLLKISKAESLLEFINFFDFTKGPEGLGMYRPLTIQAFYFLARSIFNFNPFGLHIFSFIFFFAVIYLVYDFIKTIFKNEKIALVSAFLYAFSATHFAHLYYLATFQELGLAFFFIISLKFFILFLKKRKNQYLVFSLITFVLSLLSKETAVVLPGILILLYLFLKINKEIIIKTKLFIFSLIPFVGILVIYFYYHFFRYGLAQGDSYVWDFSFYKSLNTIFWYILWSFNLPELLVDFIGPGFNVNPNLLKYWSKEIYPIFGLFGGILILLFTFSLRFLKKIKEYSLVSLLSFSFFVITLLPVLFLPMHKFTFYLTLPLIGFVSFLSFVLVEAKVSKIFVFIFLTLYFSIFLITLKLTKETHWITRSAEISQKVYFFTKENMSSLEGKTIVFYDIKEDSELPWSPVSVVKTALSDNNFFKVFFDDKVQAVYTSEFEVKDGIRIRARNFLGY